MMRLTGQKHPALTTVATTVVLIAASMLVGRSEAVDPLVGTVALDSGTGTSISERAVHVPSVSVRQARVLHTKGTPALPPSALGQLDIPVPALLAYQRAAAVMAQVDGSCGLSWTLLAAIGRVESDHGQYGGARLLSDGTSSREIRGVALDGSGPLAKIPDTDAGRLDGDTVWDRAVGPMQFLPTTWSVVGVDADGDGVRSPDDIDDAALAAGVFLCSAPGDLDTQKGVRDAVFRYNPSTSYVASVLAVERAYRAGKFATPGDLVLAAPIPVIETQSGDHSTGTRVRSGHHGQSATQQATQPGAGSGGSGGNSGSATHSGPDSPATGSTGTAGPGTPSGTPDPGGTGGNAPGPSGTPDPPPPATPDPTQTPDPAPDPPSPSEPAPIELTGVLNTCGVDQALWCLDEVTLDVGDADVLAAAAGSDFDGDGVVESNAVELAGLVGTKVTVLAAPDTDPPVVVAINGAPYALPQ